MKKYLIYSSVVLHILVIPIIVWFFSTVGTAFQHHKDWEAAIKNPEIGIVTDVSVLQRNGYVYKSYAIKFDGELIYTNDLAQDTYRVGDEVKLAFTAPDYDAVHGGSLNILGIKR